MRIEGHWSEEGGDAWPALRVRAVAADGATRQVVFMIDTGAETSLLSAEVVEELGLTASPSSARLGGVGGEVAAWAITAKLLLSNTVGGFITLNVECLTAEEPTALGVSVLGRDVLKFFAVIVDRPGGVVCLLAGNHYYAVTSA